MEEAAQCSLGSTLKMQDIHLSAVSYFLIISRTGLITIPSKTQYRRVAEGERGSDASDIDSNPTKMSSSGNENTGVRSYFKGLIFGSSGSAPSSVSVAPPQAVGVPGTQTEPTRVPAIKIPPQRQDSFPELCVTPSEAGIFEVPHMQGGFKWKKLFQSPNSPTFNQADSGRK